MMIYMPQRDSVIVKKKSSKLSQSLKKLLTSALYILPVIFFMLCMFLLTATEEDVAQGAGTSPNIWHDVVESFEDNGRIADMYARSVIDFFDYQYYFGVDTIFRLLDVLALTSILVLLSSIILGRRPRWHIKDALVFAGCFLLIFLLPYGYTYYRGFSMVHNYAIISLALLGFCLPFLRKITGDRISKIYQNPIFAILIGLIFGISANFPPLAVLAVIILAKIWQLIKSRKSSKSHRVDWRVLKMEQWEGLMFGAMIAGMIFIYTFGPGVSGYLESPVYIETYDYVAISDIFHNFGASCTRLISHAIKNFARTFGPAIFILITTGLLAWLTQHKKVKTWHWLPKSADTRNVLLAILVFCVFSTLCGMQIIMPVRLCLPAYLGLVIAIVILEKFWWRKASLASSLALSGAMITATITVIVIRGFFSVTTYQRVGKALDYIKNSEQGNLCIVDTEVVSPYHTPWKIFQQEETFVNRGASVPQTFYGKSVIFCE